MHKKLFTAFTASKAAMPLITYSWLCLKKSLQSFFSDIRPRYLIFSLSSLGILLSPFLLEAAYSVKLKDISRLEGVKRNIFLGYGLVAGLNGSGDRRSVFSKKMLASLLGDFGLQVEERRIQTRNLALVSIVAESYGYLEKGDLLNLSVASLGDARSLKGGLLLPALLKAGNGLDYIHASGNLETGLDPSLQLKASIHEGGIVETNFADPSLNRWYGKTNLTLVLKEYKPLRSAQAKQALESALPMLVVTLSGDKNLILSKKDETPIEPSLVQQIVNTEILIETMPKVIIDRRTGVLVAGSELRIDKSFIAFEDLAIDFGRQRFQSFGASNTSGPTRKQQASKYYNNVDELLTQLLTIGLSIDEIAAVFTTLKQSGALNAEVIFR